MTQKNLTTSKNNKSVTVKSQQTYVMSEFCKTFKYWYQVLYDRMQE